MNMQAFELRFGGAFGNHDDLLTLYVGELRIGQGSILF